MFDGDRDIVLPLDSINLEVCLQASAQSGVLFRFIVDMLAPVGGFHFVDAAPVPGRQ